MRNWRNDTPEGRYHKYLMEIENKYGVPDTPAKQLLYAEYASRKTLNSFWERRKEHDN
jgi:hypothetical protein